MKNIMRDIEKQKLIEIVQTQIEGKEIIPEQYDENLQELGLDSLKFIQIVVALEEEFVCEIPDTMLLLTEMNTINKMYSVLTNDALDVVELGD